MSSQLIPERDRIPTSQKIAFAIGSTTNGFTYYATTQILWNNFFNLGHKLDAAKLGLVLMVMTLWDAISDPLMGWISDNTRTRLGRRRPYLFLGAFLLAVFYPIFWHSDFDNREIVQLPLFGAVEWVYIKITLMGMAYYTCATIWAMAYYGLELELTPNYDERTRLSAFTTFAGKFSGLAVGAIMVVVTSNWAQGVDDAHLAAHPDWRPDLIVGIQTTSWFLAGLIFLVALAPALFVKERYYESEAKSQAYEPFWSGVLKSARCGPLWNLIGVAFFLVLSGMSVDGLSRYVNQFFINSGDLKAAAHIDFIRTAAQLVAGVASIPFWTWVSERLDKKWVVAIIVGGGMLGAGLNVWCLRPDLPYLQLVPSVFQAFVIAAIWMFLPSMKGDVADYDELRTGKRREGGINAFFSWFFKVAVASSVGIGGWVLSHSGFDPELTRQSPEVLRRMVAWYIWLPVLISLFTLGFVLIYPLNRTRMSSIRAQLEARRGAI